MPGLALLLLPQQFLKNYLKEGDKGGKAELTLGSLPLLEPVRRSGDTGLPMQQVKLLTKAPHAVPAPAPGGLQLEETGLFFPSSSSILPKPKECWVLISKGLAFKGIYTNIYPQTPLGTGPSLERQPGFHFVL